MLKLCVLATTLVIVISTPLQKNNIEKPHVRGKMEERNNLGMSK